MPVSEETLRSLRERAVQIRRHIVRTISDAQAGHPGGSLSAADILVALYFHVLRIDPEHPEAPDRDRFVLSKGHAAAGLYATLAERGFFSPELLATFGRIDSPLQVHPDRLKTPGVEVSTGALGQGLSVGVGMALGARLDGRSFRVYVLIGDGECQEGQIWEAAMCAAHYEVEELTAILDYNGVQLLGPIPEIMEIAPLADKWRAFGWHTIEIDGHDMAQILDALEFARTVRGRPTMILARTVKGKGVSFMEGKAAWHGRPPDPDERAQALSDLT